MLAIEQNAHTHFGASQVCIFGASSQLEQLLVSQICAPKLGYSKCAGLIRYVDFKDARAAIEAINGLVVDNHDRPLEVKYAETSQAKQERQTGKNNYKSRCVDCMPFSVVGSMLIMLDFILWGEGGGAVCNTTQHNWCNQKPCHRAVNRTCNHYLAQFDSSQATHSIESCPIPSRNNSHPHAIWLLTGFS